MYNRVECQKYIDKYPSIKRSKTFHACLGCAGGRFQMGRLDASPTFSSLCSASAVCQSENAQRRELTTPSFADVNGG